MKICVIWLLITLFSTVLDPVFGNVTQTPKRRPVFLPNSSRFEEITNCYGFVDKTLFIEFFLSYHSCYHHLFTRPRKFGKSTNMDMLKRFVQLEFDISGKVKKQNETSAYRLFTNRTLNLLISSYYNVINEHLAKYPVIHIEFKGVMGNTFKETMKNIRERVRNACLPYKGLIEVLHKKYERTNRTSIAQQVRFLKEAIHGTMGFEIIEKSLCLLAKILLNYFSREIFVFIDDYDAAIDYSLRYAHRVKYDPTKFRSLISAMMEKLFDPQILKYIKYVMINGIARGSPSMLSSYGKHFEHHHFLSDFRMRMFFGFSENEVYAVMARRRIETTEKHNIMEYYNGYYTDRSNARIYNPYSVLNYMASFRKKNITYPVSWIDAGSLDFMTEAMKNPKTYRRWLQLVLEKESYFDVGSTVDEIRLLKLSTKLKKSRRTETSRRRSFFLVLY